MNMQTISYQPTVSVIIPTLNAGEELNVLLSMLLCQKYPAEEIIVVDSSSTDNTVSVCQRYEQVRLLSVQREEFDHGRTRDMAFRQSHGNVVVFLTQDAIPADDCFLGRLVAPLEDKTIAVSVGRQLPKPDATRMEALIRSFNYPETSFVRSQKDIPSKGIKTFFCSDSCAAYRRDIYLLLGGFPNPLMTNEDMFFAAKAINGGFRIAYTADACVFHSHNFSLRQQYRRNFLQGYELERHRELIGNVSLSREGKKLVMAVSSGLLKDGAVLEFCLFGFDCCARWLGNHNGKKAYCKEAGLYAGNK